MTTDKSPEGHSDDGPPTKREAQQPIGPVDGDDTWLSGEDEHDRQREEAAEQARRAVEPASSRVIAAAPCTPQGGLGGATQLVAVSPP